MVYLIVLIVFLYPILRQSSTKNNISPKYYWLQLVLIILVAGLRNHVGGDTIGYMRDWESVDPIGEIDTINVLYLSLYYRPLCLALMYLSRTISSEFFVWQLIQATIVNVAAFYIIKKESKYYYEVALLYLLFQFLYFNMEIMRESLAVSAFYFAFKFFDKRKWFAYYLSLIVVFFFHDSVLIFFAFPLMYKIIEKDFSVKTLAFFAITGFILFNILLSSITVLLPGERGEKFLSGYSAWENATIWGTLKSCFMCVLYYFVLKYAKNRNSSYVTKGFKIFIILSIWGLFLPVITNRMTNYVKLFSLIMFGEILWGYRKLLLQRVLIVMLLFNGYRYYFNDVTNWVDSTSTKKYYFYECFYPYYSIFEEPDQIVVDRRTEIYDQQEARIK